jgi:hypothetical protein
MTTQTFSALWPTPWPTGRNKINIQFFLHKIAPCSIVKQSAICYYM